jgi:hypothetical protein
MRKILALTAALVIGPTSLAVAQSHVKAHVTTVNRPAVVPGYDYQRLPLWECETDEGQGRFFPCDAGGG